MKYALITGASSGIGKEFVKQLHAQGYTPILVSRNEEHLQKLAYEYDGIYFVCDLSNEQECMRLCIKLKAYDIEVVINNAGIGAVGSFQDVPLEKEIDMININIKAMHILLKSMLKQESVKTILNVASSAGLCKAGPYMATYYATKGYVVMLSRALQYEHPNAYIACLCPGPVQTAFDAKAGVKGKRKGITPRECVSYTLKQMKKNKRIIIPTMTMRFVVAVINILPEFISIPLVRMTQKKKL